MSRKKWAGAILLFALLLATFAFSFDGRPPVYAAPNAAVTPVGVENFATGKTGQLIPMVTAAVTADARYCKDTRDWTQLDIQTVVEWAATPDTVTVYLEHSNDNVNYVDGPQLVATVVANTDALNRYDTYGAYTCVYVNVANPSASNYPNIKVLALPKQ